MAECCHYLGQAELQKNLIQNAGSKKSGQGCE